jgi:hypothetical protein
MMGGEGHHIHGLNDAVGSNDLQRFTEGMTPDAAWEHNIGSGSPEEGVYEGRDQIRQLFERILEGWEFMRPDATEIRDGLLARARMVIGSTASVG